MTGTKTVAVTAIWLRRSGRDAVVAVEIDGSWRDVIVERSEGNFSHIVDTRGIIASPASVL